MSNVIKTYFYSHSVRETLHFGPDFNLVMDKESVKSVPDIVPSTSSKRCAISSGYKLSPSPQVITLHLYNDVFSIKCFVHVLPPGVLHLSLVSSWGESG